MRIITRKRIYDFAKKHSNSKKVLNEWYNIVDKSDYSSFTDLRKTFPRADKVQNLTIFNVGGNKYRLIAAIHYNTKCIFIRHILTHSDYDKGLWKKDLK